MNTYTAGESLISEIVAFISELVPIHVEETRNRLSAIFAKYHVTKVEQDEVHTDLTYNINLLLSSNKLESFIEYSLQGYYLEVKSFSEKVKKRTEDISA